MPIYSYKGLTRAGKEIKSGVSADSVNQAKIKLKSQGIMLLDIKEQKAKSSSSLLNVGKSVSVEELSLMTRQFATLIGAKIQVVQSLSALTDQVDNQQLRVVLGEIKQDVNEGSSLSKAFGKHPKIFNHVYVNMVEAGESSGTLGIVLQRLAGFSEDQVKLKNKLKSALTYPILMATIGTIGMGIILTTVIPKITGMLVKSKIELPQITKITMALSSFLQNYWYMVIIGIILFTLVLYKYVNTKSGQRNWHSLQLKLPIFGKLVKMVNVERFCSTLATLLGSGVPILTALRISKNLIPNVHMQEAIERARINVSEGGTMAAPLADSGLFPSMVTHMIGLGEKAGEVEQMLEIVADNYHDQVESQLAGLTSLLEPLMMIFMGVIVGTIVFAVVMPMLKMGSIGR